MSDDIMSFKQAIEWEDWQGLITTFTFDTIGRHGWLFRGASGRLHNHLLTILRPTDPEYLRKDANKPRFYGPRRPPFVCTEKVVVAG